MFKYLAMTSSVFIIGLSACNKNGSQMISTSPNSVLRGADDSCGDGLAAFTKNLYTPILRQSCVECHDANQNGPPHSTGDVNASYALIKTYVNFAQIDKSRIISRVKSQHWLNYDEKKIYQISAQKKRVFQIFLLSSYLGRMD